MEPRRSGPKSPEEGTWFGSLLFSPWPPQRSFYDTSSRVRQILPQSSSRTPTSTDLHSPLAPAQYPTAIVADLFPVFELRAENPEKRAFEGREENWWGGSPRLVGTELWSREGCKCLWETSGQILEQCPVERCLSLKIPLDCFRLEKVFPVSSPGEWPFDIESTAEMIIYTR